MPDQNPTQPKGRHRPQQSELNIVIRRNIQNLLEHRRQIDRRRTVQDAVADRITAFTGTLRFVYMHAAFVGGWLLINLGVVPGVRPFDPFPFVMLAMIARWRRSSSPPSCSSARTGWPSSPTVGPIWTCR